MASQERRSCSGSAIPAISIRSNASLQSTPQILPESFTVPEFWTTGDWADKTGAAFAQSCRRKHMGPCTCIGPCVTPARRRQAFS